MRGAHLDRLLDRGHAASALSLLLAACTALQPEGEVEVHPTPLMRQAELIASACLTVHHLPIKSPTLRWFVVPGDHLTGMEGYAYGRAGKVTVPTFFQDQLPVLAHEALHAMGHLPGGLNGLPHPPVFRDCGLYPL